MSAFPAYQHDAAPELVLTGVTLCPLRIKELLDPEFVPDGPFLDLSNDRCEIFGAYGPLPAAVASDPAVFACFIGESEQGSPALVAVKWSLGEVVFQVINPSVDGSTPTVAEAGGASSASGGGLAA